MIACTCHRKVGEKYDDLLIDWRKALGTQLRGFANEALKDAADAGVVSIDCIGPSGCT